MTDSDVLTLFKIIGEIIGGAIVAIIYTNAFVLLVLGDFYIVPWIYIPITFVITILLFLVLGLRIFSVVFFITGILFMILSNNSSGLI